MSILNRSTAEFIGTFRLVFGGCGSAVLAAAFPELGIGFLGCSDRGCDSGRFNLSVGEWRKEVA